MHGRTFVAGAEENGPGTDATHASLLHKYGYFGRAGHHVGRLDTYQKLILTDLFLHDDARTAHVAFGNERKSE